jgi:hypothetical protein
LKHVDRVIVPRGWHAVLGIARFGTAPGVDFAVSDLQKISDASLSNGAVAKSLKIIK